MLGRAVREPNFNIIGIVVELRGNRARVQFSGENHFEWFNVEDLTLVNF